MIGLVLGEGAALGGGSFHGEAKEGTIKIPQGENQTESARRGAMPL